MDPRNVAAFDAAQTDLAQLGEAAVMTAGVKLAIKRFVGSLTQEPTVQALLAGGLTAGSAAAGTVNPALGVLVNVLGAPMLAELEALGASWKDSK